MAVPRMCRCVDVVGIGILFFVNLKRFLCLVSKKDVLLLYIYLWGEQEGKQLFRLKMKIRARLKVRKGVTRMKNFHKIYEI